MTKRAAKLLLSVFLLTQVSSLCWNLYKPLSHLWFETIHEIRHEWFGDQTTLISITIDRATLKELQNDDDEITIGGMLYDIDHAAAKGNKITLFLECDVEETRSNAQYAQLNKQLHKNTATATVPAYRIAFFAFFFSKQIATTIPVPVAAKKKYNALPQQTYSDHFLSIINPPPEVS